MIDKITKSKFRNLLDEVGYRTALDSDGDFYNVLDADEDFNHDVVVYYIVNEEKHTVSVIAIASDFDVKENDKAHALLKCNQWNIDHTIGQAYLKKNEIQFRCGFFLDEPISESFVKENVIKTSTSLAWSFYSNLNN
jgi:arsenate reductase-like glutaredoxin family protein